MVVNPVVDAVVSSVVSLVGSSYPYSQTSDNEDTRVFGDEFDDTFG